MKLKHFFKVLFSGITWKIQEGPLKGKKWCITTSIRYIKGYYVKRDADILINNVGRGETVYDIGAHVGYFSVLCSDIVGDKGKIYAFEPVPMNLLFLKKHTKMNKCKNIKIFNTCIADRIGYEYFDNTEGSATGHLSVKGKLKVNVNTLDNLLLNGDAEPPDFIKINAEGAEQSILSGGMGIIQKFQPNLLITFHSEELKENCIKILSKYDYKIHITAEDALYATCR